MDAESLRTGRSEPDAEMRTRPTAELLQELQVCQIELEMKHEELRRAQQFLEVSQESAQRLAGLIESAMDAIIAIDNNQRIVLFNPAAEQMFGLAADKALGQPLDQLLPQAFRQAHAEHIRSFGRTGITSRSMRTLGTLSGLRANGDEFPIEASISQIEVQSGKLYTVILRDITERKRVEEALAKSQRQLRLFVEQAPISIAMLDRNLNYIATSRRWIAEYGRGYDDLTGRNHYEVHPDVSDEWKKVHRDALAGAIVKNDDDIWVQADGSKHWLRWAVHPWTDESGNIGGIIISAEDITARRLAEQGLRDSQADMSRAQAVGQIGSWRLNVQHNELLWSDENHRIFGIPRGTPLTYETFLSTVHPDDREYVDRMWMAGLQGAPYDIEHRLVVGGEVKWVREKAELEFDEEGRLLGGFGTTQDITELKQAELALIEADQRKDEFLAMLAHELRNPLTPIRNAAHVLGRLGIQEPRVQWAQETIERQVVHLTQLVDDLLDVSRIVHGKVVLKKESVELAALVSQAMDMALPLIEAKGHRIEVRLPTEPVHLEGDPVRLSQVLLNLLDNAVKYTPNGGKIELEARVEGRVIEIRVRDNGIGIPKELLPGVFDLFQQGERTLDRTQGGLGIGLTLVKRLVEMHGGLLEANSAGPGLGSEFTIWLPALSGTSMADSEDVPEPAPASANCRVLVVDDDPAVADSTAMLLQIEGHDVRTAATGEAALELARSFRPQLVLLDIGLQGMDGYEVARRLRAQQAENEKICLVAITGYGHEEARVRSEAAGFDRHLVKPVYPEAIYDLLAEIG